MSAIACAKRLVLAGSVLGGALVAACAGSPQSAGAPAIARVHRARCGSCHTRVEPGERTHDYLEAALSRHRGRVHLSEAQWEEMVAYLSASPDAGAPASDVH